MFYFIAYTKLCNDINTGEVNNGVGNVREMAATKLSIRYVKIKLVSDEKRNLFSDRLNNLRNVVQVATGCENSHRLIYVEAKICSEVRFLTQQESKKYPLFAIPF